MNAQKMDPQLRKLLEVSYEAWIDSGINHGDLRGSEKVRGIFCSKSLGQFRFLARCLLMSCFWHAERLQC